jgi:hypothetical protein
MIQLWESNNDKKKEEKKETETEDNTTTATNNNTKKNTNDNIKNNHNKRAASMPLAVTWQSSTLYASDKTNDATAHWKACSHRSIHNTTPIRHQVLQQLHHFGILKLPHGHVAARMDHQQRRA